MKQKTLPKLDRKSGHSTAREVEQSTHSFEFGTEGVMGHANH